MADSLNLALQLIQGATAAAAQPMILQAQMLREDRLRKEAMQREDDLLTRRETREDAMLDRQEKRQDTIREEDRKFAKQQQEIDTDNRFALAQMELDAQSKMRADDDQRRQDYYNIVQTDQSKAAAKGYAMTQQQLVSLEKEMESVINQFPTEDATIEKAQANALLNAGLLSDQLSKRIFRADGSVSSEQLRQAVALLMSNKKTKADAQQVMMALEENLFSENSPLMLRNQQLAMRIKPLLERRAGLYATQRRLLESAPGLSEYTDILEEDVMGQIVQSQPKPQATDDDLFSLPTQNAQQPPRVPAPPQYSQGMGVSKTPQVDFSALLPEGKLPTVPEGAMFELGRLGNDAANIRSVFNSN